MNPELKVFVIIPVFNDAATISQVTGELIGSGYHHIVVVDDGSSQDVRKELKCSHVHYLRHPVNLGQGAALQTGIQYALRCGADILVTFDGDGQHDAADVAGLVQALVHRRADVVLGSRFLKRGKDDMRVSRLVILKAARLVNFLLSGILLSDAHNGLRAFTSRAAASLHITENRMAHASEILFEIKRHRMNFFEMPVTVRYTEYSRGKGQSNWNGIRIFFDLLLHKIFN